ncbi:MULTISPECIES: hypothetical protein [Leptolyngbya]|uniref:hypothetical protein n=1 Tax=Leptolyngbya TaxID=47251 RepID=UPI001688B163|nr:hypothetical protein [Leptolyngbya sp. FACHB-1624]MBD1857964.1 hypothetical protein [Leptolyngbya sp. FACHB-1624]
MPKDDGTPKVLIETNSLFGDKRVEQVKVDSNRLDPIATAKNRLIDSLIHPYFLDAVGDAVCWVSATCFIVSIMRHTPFLDYFAAPFFLLLTVAAAGAIAAIWTIPEVGGALILRAVFILIGLALGDAL